MVLQVILCSACSGHGYKFCSVIGEILADLAINSTTQHRIGDHRIKADRPGQQQALQHFADEVLHTREQAIRAMHAPISRL